MNLDPPTLVRALRAMPSRHSQLLVKWRLQAMSREALGEHYGVKGEPLDCLLLRAARDLAAALRGEAQAPALPWGEERRLAAGLRTGSPALVPLAASLEALSSTRVETLTALRAAELAAEASPARARERWLRRAAVLVILVLTGFFYLRDHPQAVARAKSAVNRFLGTSF